MSSSVTPSMENIQQRTQYETLGHVVCLAAERSFGSYKDGRAKSVSHYILVIEGGSRHRHGNNDGDGPMNANPSAETPQ
eukprot:COSAG02_NODE_35372_length_469_cov_0.975676_1_plen_78_part_10